ncbi:hypothetical protein DB88DRAFT_476877 [Papiliotrema laurentii]|uniref:Uncharacterized protein n=1 Tax=Papiliotrema laurentii TaxID=5418 RepID=A0AAD9FVV8_PAPLA|nr:hypothetical protein DB88DRAFT_476877 [Papiliotrema laurentii]
MTIAHDGGGVNSDLGPFAWTTRILASDYKPFSPRVNLISPYHSPFKTNITQPQLLHLQKKNHTTPWRICESSVHPPLSPVTTPLILVMDHYAPHPSAAFEGYYSRFSLPDHSSVCLIVSSVPAAERSATSIADLRSKRPFYIVLTYTGPDSSRVVQKEFWPDAFAVDDAHKDTIGFTIAWDSGHLKWDRRTDTVSWNLDTPVARFIAETNGERVPWKKGDRRSTPAGLIASLPSPIQWHVHSLSSDCTFELSLPEEGIEDEGQAKVHYEKNWAVSFPDSYIWLQARDHERQTGVCLAGGSLLPGVQAFLVGYHGSHAVNRHVSYIPWSIFGFTLSGLSTTISWPERQFKVDIQGWFKRLRITATAPKETFFNFAAPLRTGHQPDYCTQSYQTTVEVEVSERQWPWQGWVVTEREEYERGGMEFGGEFMKRHDE